MAAGVPQSSALRTCSLTQGRRTHGSLAHVTNTGHRSHDPVKEADPRKATPLTFVQTLSISFFSPQALRTAGQSGATKDTALKSIGQCVSNSRHRTCIFRETSTQEGLRSRPGRDEPFPSRSNFLRLENTLESPGDRWSPPRLRLHSQVAGSGLKHQQAVPSARGQQGGSGQLCWPSGVGVVRACVPGDDGGAPHIAGLCLIRIHTPGVGTPSCMSPHSDIRQKEFKRCPCQSAGASTLCEESRDGIHFNSDGISLQS
ncbi:PREDICTED: uncharacterized protein LOC102027213 [Chinchilla lanigera]|uniref:uncharacterized protein LOC102027213 n=1 Tax=Chinchilla lanigera TaxID=34839 RepID=UPI00038F1488|nr:PREDICTED: uncharacterized protein LOC102027213 [Chinchilla lanigera]